jgi:hypothetical protein
MRRPKEHRILVWNGRLPFATSEPIVSPSGYAAVLAIILAAVPKIEMWGREVEVREARWSRVG